MPTVLHRLSRWAEESPRAPAQGYKEKDKWKILSSSEVMNRVYSLALYLESRGIKRGDVGVIFAYNSPAWVQSELALVLFGAKSAGIFPNSTSEDIQYILNHTGARVLFVQDEAYFKRIIAGGAKLPESVELVVVFDGNTTISPHAVSFEKALKEGKKLSKKRGAKSLKKYLSALDPHDPLFIIYTSGTTGTPKGALLSNDNLVFTADVAAKAWNLPFAGKNSLFSFLPLCHVAEKIHNLGAGITQRYTVYYCTRIEKVAKELAEVQPTMLLCVPRLWEKMMEGVLNKLKRQKGFRRYLAEWALRAGTRNAKAVYTGGSPGFSGLAERAFADRMVLKKIRSALGLGRAHTVASGAAALPAHVAHWFRALRLEILEDYGQTESTGVITMTEPGVESAGAVGRALAGIEMKIAEDGEVLTRGRHVFKGYFKDEKGTSQVLDPPEPGATQGWLHTGDLGEIDSRGLLVIRGRKKEILKTSGGKMVAPLPIEEALKEAPIISQVCMVGDGRKYLSALITLEETLLTDIQSRSKISDGLVAEPGVIEEVGKHIDRVNSSLAAYEQIKRFAVLGQQFSIDAGEMTPTLKMKRNVIENRYRDVIERLYG